MLKDSLPCTRSLVLYGKPSGEADVSDPSAARAGHLASTATSSEVADGERGEVAERASPAPPPEPHQPAVYRESHDSVGPWWRRA